MRRCRALIYSILLVSLCLPHSALGKCAGFLDRFSNLSLPPPPYINPTDGLISYLSELLQNKTIGDPELLTLVSDLSEGVVRNPISLSSTKINQTRLVHFGGIETFIQGKRLNKKKLLAFAKRALKERSDLGVERNKESLKTEHIFQPIQFWVVPPGTFKMGNSENRVEVTLTHEIEVMATPVTQFMWIDLMGENPSELRTTYRQKDAKPEKIKTNDRKVVALPDHPVDYITWWSALEFANRLSIRHGLKPAYDLSQIHFFSSSSAELGSLRSIRKEDHDPGAVIIKAPDQDIYRAEGYRLPTEAEQEYLLRLAGHFDGAYFPTGKTSGLKTHAWHSDNSLGEPHPVGSKRPLQFAGHRFFDLFGNVWELSFDQGAEVLQGGINPVQTFGSDMRIVRGGSYESAPGELSTFERHAVLHDAPTGGVGLRLVRTIR